LNSDYALSVYIFQIGFCGFRAGAGFGLPLAQRFPAVRHRLSGAEEIGVHGAGFSAGATRCH